MLGSGPWALLLLSLLRATAGIPRLAPPRNVTLFSQDFGVYLTWLPGLGNPQNVTYFVTYQGLITPKRWRKVERCNGTQALLCPLMCLEKQDLYTKFKGRVQAVSANVKSPKVESEYLDYFFEVELAPPTLEFTWMEKILRVNASYQLPPCMPPMDLKYEVELWAEGAINKTLFPATLYGQPVHIPLKRRTGRRHCLRARTIYATTSKYSRFSEPNCLLLEAPGASWAVLALPSVLPLLLVLAIGGMIWKSVKGNPWFELERMPLALDFSGCRLPTVTWQPSGAESLDDVILCPPKELPRRARLAPRVRCPPTGQAGSVDSAEDEDEDTDVCDSFHDYLSSPLLLAQELHPARPSDESRVCSGGTWIPPGPCPGSPAWDSSPGSSPSTGDSSFLEEAGSPSCVVAESGQGQGGDRCQDSVALLDSSEDSGSPEEPQKDDLSWWTTWGSPAPQRSLVPGEPPVSLQTFTFCWGSGPEEEEEWEEEEEEEESERGSEPNDSSTGSGGAEYLQKAQFKGGVPGHYLARTLPG
ncbi:interferon lambda receptor 1 isoform X2 [Perognathus longimembris pacificus]|uniref:interferon lambda receptor 1 isoform X2 n=1 Tax=Perognathus longimembris pacificus TaxID=214514 RepID=UPI002019C20B|nr:interferon lambda receptor 1 isoform X2 [Perognathus longimembris pacificus]